MYRFLHANSFRVTIESKARNRESVNPLPADAPNLYNPIYYSTLNLIDLAGSECASGLDEHPATLKAEMSCINKVRAYSST